MGKEEKKKEENNNHEFIISSNTPLFSPSLASSTPIVLTSLSSIYNAVSDLRSTFDVKQKSIAQSYNLDQHLNYFKQIAENMEKSVKLAEKQRDDAIEDAKTERKRFYVTLGVTIILGIVALIVGIMAL